MADGQITLLVGIIIAVLGSIGGFAALMKVNADNSKTVSEGATNVVKMLREQVDELDARLGLLEQYADEMDAWSQRVVDLLAKAVNALEAEQRDPFAVDAASLVRSRPRRRQHA